MNTAAWLASGKRFGPELNLGTPALQMVLGFGVAVAPKKSRGLPPAAVQATEGKLGDRLEQLDTAVQGLGEAAKERGRQGALTNERLARVEGQLLAELKEVRSRTRAPPTHSLRGTPGPGQGSCMEGKKGQDIRGQEDRQDIQ